MLIKILCSIGLGFLIVATIKSFWNYYHPNLGKAIRIGPYPFYETREDIAELWHDYQRIGHCDICGCEDAPIVEGPNDHALLLYYSSRKCKWCSELHNLRQHLATQRVG